MARLRFRPPPIEPTAELAWVLLAAFAEQFPERLEADQEQTALALAHRLGLASAIGARLREAADAIEITEPMAVSFRKAHAQSAILTVRHERTARRIAEIAETRSIPITFLKGYALFLSGRDRGGGRAIGDLDLLAPEESARSLHAELAGHGYRAESEHGNEHHLSTLVSPEGTSVDLHFCLRGLSLEASSWTTWDDLSHRDALLPARGYPANCTLPELSVQTAHLIAHGLVHHVWRPHTYPLLLLVGDLQELVPDDTAWQVFLGEFRPILLRSVHEPELDGLRRLARELHLGRVPALGAQPAEDTAILLRHILGGYLDPTYGRRLRLRHVVSRLADAARQGRLKHYLSRKAARKRID